MLGGLVGFALRVSFKAIAATLRYGWRLILASAVIAASFDWRLAPVCISLLVLFIVEAVLYRVWPWFASGGWRWSIVLGIPLGIARQRRIRRARRIGNRLLRSAGLVRITDDTDYPAYVYPAGPSGRTFNGYVPYLPGLSRGKLQQTITEYANRVGAVGGEIHREGTSGWWVRFWRFMPSLPRVATYPEAQLATVDRVPVGVDLDGQMVSVVLRESNLLVAGLPGSGKSALLSALLAGAASMPNVVLIGFDPKIVELAAWRVAFARVYTEEDDFLPGLEALGDQMDARYRHIESMSLRKLEAFTAELPLIVVVVDELAEIVQTGDAKRDKAIALALRRLIQKGRAAGICVIAATQRPSADIVPTSLRDLFIQRVALATSTVEMSRMILGDYGQTGDGPVDGPHTVSGVEKGVGFVMAATDRVPRKFKAYWLDDAAIAARAGSAVTSQRLGLENHAGC